MNYPEKIAGAYLRLNGFFLLPHFTVFDQQYHTHVDFLALRPPFGQESVNKDEPIIFPIDNYFMNTISECVNNPKANFVGSVVEVKSGGKKEVPSPEHIEYAKRFFGNEVEIFKLSFYSYDGKPKKSNDGITVSVKYAKQWIFKRFEWMDDKLKGISKSGSWYMSEENLSDLLWFFRH